jgi:predicted MFS family arabinose efflux permease
MVSALATSAFNIGGAGGTWLAGLTLSTSLGLRGPALIGLVLTPASMVPLTALAAVRSAARLRASRLRGRATTPETPCLHHV